MRSRPSLLPSGAIADVIATIAVAAAARLAIGPVFLNFDAFYALIWGDQIAHGTVPDYFAADAPAPHPLAEAVGVLVSPLGSTVAIDVLYAVGALSIGALCVGLFRLGEALFAPMVGVVAATLMATRIPTLQFGVGAYVDIPTAALVVWAGVLEARRPRRRAAVLALLAIAGLLRAEIWLFSLVYLLWMLPARTWPERLRLAAIAAVGPVVWLLTNAIVTGSPFEPSHGSRISITERLLGYPNPNSRTGLLAVPDAFTRDLANWLRPVPLLIAAVGLVVGAILLRRGTRLPVAVAAVSTTTFACLALVGLPIEQRYLAPTAAILALLAGVAAAGWLASPRERRPRAAVVIGAAAGAALILQFALVDLGRVGAARSAHAAENRLQADLRALVERSGPKEELQRARGVLVPNARLQPQLAVWTGRSPRVFTTDPGAGATERLIISPRTPAASAYVGADAPAAAGAPAGFRVLAATRSWILWRHDPHAG